MLFGFRHFFTFGALLFDRMVILNKGTDFYRFELCGQEHLVRALEGGRGVVLLTAHLGNWELLGQYLCRMGKPLTAVMYDGVQQEVRETLERINTGRLFRVLYTDGSPAAAAAILSTLARGEAVGMMGDRVLGDEGVRVKILGGTALLPSGPFAVAAASGAPVVYSFAIRMPGRRYSLCSLPPVTCRHSSPRDRSADLQTWVEDFARTLEQMLRSYPTQWGNFFSFWEESPSTDVS